MIRRSLVLAVSLAAPLGALGAGALAPADPPPARTASASLDDLSLFADPRFAGRSGKLRVALVPPEEELLLPFQLSLPSLGEARFRWVPLFGSPGPGLLGTVPAQGLQAPLHAGIWRLEAERPDLDGATPVFNFITRVPFGRKQGAMLNGYHIGRYPTEGTGRTDEYAPPVGFIEVTRENQDFQVSEHFRLRQFLTKDQFDVWPKYLVLDLRLIDKLELVLQELNAMGVRADRMHVMSGFRTPQYNGPGEGGRARLSRHTYGDAADVWVDSDGSGKMDDLNGDGRIDIDDAALIQRAVERVERRHPELVGGSGTYTGLGDLGPFIHVDVRGHHARW
jgi:hypothetical protein